MERYEQPKQTLAPKREKASASAMSGTPACAPANEDNQSRARSVFLTVANDQ